MNVGQVDPLVAAKGRFRANQDMDLRLSIANLVPDSLMTEVRGAVEFLQFQDISVKLACAFQVLNRNRKMMEAEFVHGEPSDERSRRQTTCCIEDLVPIL